MAARHSDVRKGMRGGTCSSCIYWRRAVRARWQSFDERGRTVQVEHAQCRRHAPRSRVEYRSVTAEAVWPETNADDWCGEHDAGRVAENMATDG